MRNRHRFLLAFDLAAVLAFVVIGRDTHDEGSTLSGTIETAAPFLIALVIGWGVARAWHTPEWPKTGALVAVVTVTFGMFVRNSWFDEGTALSFVIVAAVFLGGTMVCWRVAYTEFNRWRFRRRRRQASIEPSK